MRRWWRKAEPVPPTNVRLVYADGRVVPVECVYKGVENGIHIWSAVVPATAALEPGMSLQADMLPAKTGLDDPGG